MPDTAPSDFSTTAIHAGQEFDPTTGAVIPPVYFTTTFVQDGIGGFRNGYEYARGGNPTRDALQTLLAALEGGDRAFSFASGLAGEDTLLRAILRPNDHVLMGNDVYGGSHRLVNRTLVPWGVSLSTVDMSDLDAVKSHIRAGATKVVWVETPSNPLMKITDIAGVAELAHAAGAIVVVDNTFASPYLQQPAVARRRRDRALHHQVPRRPQRRARRRGRREERHPRGRREPGRQGGLPAVRGGRRLRPDGCLAHHPRHQDPGGAHGSPLVERPDHRREAGRTSQARARSTTRACPTTRATSWRPGR